MIGSERTVVRAQFLSKGLTSQWKKKKVTHEVVGGVHCTRRMQADSTKSVQGLQKLLRDGAGPSSLGEGSPQMRREKSRC